MFFVVLRRMAQNPLGLWAPIRLAPVHVHAIAGRIVIWLGRSMALVTTKGLSAPLPSARQMACRATVGSNVRLCHQRFDTLGYSCSCSCSSAGGGGRHGRFQFSLL